MFYMAYFDDDPRRERYLDWLLTTKRYRNPPTTNAIAEELRVNRRTLRDWRYHPEFLAEWDRRVKETVGSPDRVKQLFDTLFATATDPEDGKHVQAAQSYFKNLTEISPPKDAQAGFDLSSLSTEELQDMLTRSVVKELEEREGVVSE